MWQRLLKLSKHSCLHFKNYRHILLLILLAALVKTFCVYTKSIFCLSVSHQMISHLLIHKLFILVFMLQKNDGCLITLQMNFASQLYGRCYLLPEQLSKDQNSTSNKSKLLHWVVFHRHHSLSSSHRLYITVMTGGRTSLRIISH